MLPSWSNGRKDGCSVPKLQSQAFVLQKECSCPRIFSDSSKSLGQLIDHVLSRRTKRPECLDPKGNEIMNLTQVPVFGLFCDPLRRLLLSLRFKGGEFYVAGWRPREPICFPSAREYCDIIWRYS
ncbi:hypothetical protein ACOME3_000491 [Neoechinorhynchus agilis]